MIIQAYLRADLQCNQVAAGRGWSHTVRMRAGMSSSRWHLLPVITLIGLPVPFHFASFARSFTEQVHGAIAVDNHAILNSILLTSSVRASFVVQWAGMTPKLVDQWLQDCEAKQSTAPYVPRR